MRRLLSVALASGLVFGCGDSFSPEGVAGTYTLEIVNGNSLPFSETFSDGGVTFTIEITSGTLRIQSDNTFSFVVEVSATAGGQTLTETETTSGTYTLEEPSTIRFTESDGTTSTGTVSGDTITIIDDGDTFVFKKFRSNLILIEIDPLPDPGRWGFV